MANRKSAARQALKDMLECKLDITFFKGKVRHLHLLNEEIGIIREETIPAVKIEVEVKVIPNYMVREALEPRPTKKYYRAPDGSIVSSLEAIYNWDRD